VLLAAIAAWRGSAIRIGSTAVRITGRPYLAILALAAAVGVAALTAAHRERIGPGLVVAGTLALVMGRLRSGTAPLGGIGEGGANLGIVLVAAGWGVIAAQLASRAGLARALGRLGSVLTAVDARLDRPLDGAAS
jgi:hypothetical protein